MFFITYPYRKDGYPYLLGKGPFPSPGRSDPGPDISSEKRGYHKRLAVIRMGKKRNVGSRQGRRLPPIPAPQAPVPRQFKASPNPPTLEGS
jgi:hypothetical protein